MTMRSQDNAKGNARAGLPLARAKRLAAETDRQARKGRVGVLYGFGLLGVAGLVGLGVMSSEPATQANGSVALATIAQAPAAAAAPSLPDALPVAAPDPTPEPDQAVLTSIPVDPTQPACVQAVETRLDALYQMSRAEADASGVEGAMQGLVQAALDCDKTQLRITGSMELIGTNLADIRVRWGRANRLLDLAMVEIADRQAERPVADIGDDLVEFVVR